MNKRKVFPTPLCRKRAKKCNRKRQKTSLPEVEEDFISDPITSFEDSDLLDSSWLDEGCDSNSDEDSNLPEGLITSIADDDHVKSRDLLWIKHDRRSCFWPAYVKIVLKNRIKVYYVGCNKFVKGERTFGYSLKSENVKVFHTKDKDTFIQNGRDYCQALDRSKNDGNNAEVRLFNEALRVAETYILAQRNQSLASEDDILEFFATSGLSLLQKKCIEEFNTGHTEESLQRGTAASGQLCVDESLPSVSAVTTEPLPSTSLRMTPPSSEDETNVTDSSAVDKLTALVKSAPSQPCSQDLEHKKCFDETKENVVLHITKGACDEYLLGVTATQFDSKRMEAFLEKWPSDTHEPSDKKLQLQHVYYEDGDQLQRVCAHLTNFTARHFPDMNLIKRDDLIFHVLLPEATICSIRHVRRRNYDAAEKLFLRGCYSGKKSSDLLLNTPLTEEERTSVLRQVSWRTDRSLSLPG